MKPTLKWTSVLRVGMTVALLGVSLLAVAVGIAVRTGRLGLEPVLSGSMRPTFSPGDLVAAWRVPISSLQKGDVIMFAPPGQTKREMHRIVAIKRSYGKTLVRTKGDANNVKDPWGRISLRGKYAYRLAAVIPKVGWISQIPRAIIVPLCLVCAGLVFLVSASRQLFKKDERPERDVPNMQSFTRGYFPTHNQ
jgi:signal peptidase I